MNTFDLFLLEILFEISFVKTTIPLFFLEILLVVFLESPLQLRNIKTKQSKRTPIRSASVFTAPCANDNLDSSPDKDLLEVFRRWGHLHKSSASPLEPKKRQLGTGRWRWRSSEKMVATVKKETHILYKPQTAFFIDLIVKKKKKRCGLPSSSPSHNFPSRLWSSAGARQRLTW